MKIRSLTFRTKILLSYLAVFALFALITIPLMTRIVNTIAMSTMEDRADELLVKLKEAPNDAALVELLKKEKPIIFFRISIINDHRKILFDSHTWELLDQSFVHSYVADTPEITQALRNGKGYSEGYSEILQQNLSYLAKTFDFHGKTYLIRLAFPYKFFSKLAFDCEIAFLVLTAIILVLFSLITWFVIDYFTNPIQQILSAITPYYEGKQSDIPEIKLTSANDEYGRLANTLNSLSNRIQTHINSLKDFVANASHELKTPITVIQGFAETLHDNPTLPRPTQKEVTKKIVSNCERMTTIINNLLILSNIENLPKAQFVECNLADIIQTCCDRLKDLYSHVQLTFDNPSKKQVMIIANSNLIELAIINILINAAKYSKHNPQIKVSVTSHVNSVSVNITDQGIGIPQRDITHIFERFYRVNHKEQKTSGSGLGLSIAQTIIQKHGGTISVRSKVDGGSTFTITLPIEKYT